MRNFKEIEFNMGGIPCFNRMDKTFLDKLDDLRDEYGYPVHLNSSFRTKQYNKEIGGSTASKHMEGIAVDIRCTSSVRRARLVYAALDLGLSVGVAKTFVHVDDRKDQLMFTY